MSEMVNSRHSTLPNTFKKAMSIFGSIPGIMALVQRDRLTRRRGTFHNSRYRDGRRSAGHRLGIVTPEFADGKRTARPAPRAARRYIVNHA
jgi:hypothetical protein